MERAENRQSEPRNGAADLYRRRRAESHVQHSPKSTVKKKTTSSKSVTDTVS